MFHFRPMGTEVIFMKDNRQRSSLAKIREIWEQIKKVICSNKKTLIKILSGFFIAFGALILVAPNISNAWNTTIAVSKLCLLITCTGLALVAHPQVEQGNEKDIKKIEQQPTTIQKVSDSFNKHKPKSMNGEEICLGCFCCGIIGQAGARFCDLIINQVQVLYTSISETATTRQAISIALLFIGIYFMLSPILTLIARKCIECIKEHLLNS